jgi:hypothetical protein
MHCLEISCFRNSLKQRSRPKNDFKSQIRRLKRAIILIGGTLYNSGHTLAAETSDA